MKSRILITRFSALGDVLMAVPVVDALARRYPELDITFVSRPNVGSIFALLPPNVHFKGIQPHGKSIFEIFRELKPIDPDCIADFHLVFRTISLDILFWLKGKKVRHISKDLVKTRLFLKKRPVCQRKTTFERYGEVLARLGYPVELDYGMKYSLSGLNVHGNPPRPEDASMQGNDTDAQRYGTGFAPFAAHRGKMLPAEMCEELAVRLSERGPVYLFGAGEREKAILDRWAAKHEGLHNMAGRLNSLAAEMEFISGLELMVCMDSANMHLASLAGTRVVSLWGATHPLAGFLGWGQKIADCVQKDLPCRPCSIYGNRKCAFGDYRCLDRELADSLLDRIV